MSYSKIKEITEIKKSFSEISHLVFFAHLPTLEEQHLKKLNEFFKELQQGRKNANGAHLETLTGFPAGVMSLRLNDQYRLLLFKFSHAGQDYYIPLEVIPHTYKEAQNKYNTTRGGWLAQLLGINKEPVTIKSEILKMQIVELVRQQQQLLQAEEKKQAEVAALANLQYYNEQVVGLSVEQNRVFGNLQHNLPNTKFTILSGPAGSGKTLGLADQMIQAYHQLAGFAQQEQQTKRILYITASRALAHAYRQNWQAMNNTDPNVIVEIYSIEEWFAQHFPSRTVVGYEEFKTFALENAAIKRYFTQKKIIQENAKEKTRQFLYQQLECLARKEKTNVLIPNIFENYQNFLSHNNKIDPSLADCSSILNKSYYDFVAIDEMAIMPPNLVVQLVDASKQAIATLDSHQDFSRYASEPVHLRMQKAIQSATQNPRLIIPMFELTVSHRYPPEVAAVATKIIDLKNHIRGGVGYKEEPRSVESENIKPKAGKITYLECESAETNIIEQYNSLKQQDEINSIAIIVFSAAEKETLLKEINEQQNIPIYTVEEAVGLEFDQVLIYNPFSLNVFNEVIKQNNIPSANDETKQHRAADRKEQDHTKAIVLLNQFFVACTRTKEDLIIVQEKPKKDYRLLLEYFAIFPTTLAQQEALAAVQKALDSDPDSWQAEKCYEDYLTLFPESHKPKESFENFKQKYLHDKRKNEAWDQFKRSLTYPFQLATITAESKELFVTYYQIIHPGNQEVAAAILQQALNKALLDLTQTAAGILKEVEVCLIENLSSSQQKQQQLNYAKSRYAEYLHFIKQVPAAESSQAIINEFSKFQQEVEEQYHASLQLAQKQQQKQALIEQQKQQERVKRGSCLKGIASSLSKVTKKLTKINTLSPINYGPTNQDVAEAFKKSVIEEVTATKNEIEALQEEAQRDMTSITRIEEILKIVQDKSGEVESVDIILQGQLHALNFPAAQPVNSNSKLTHPKIMSMFTQINDAPFPNEISIIWQQIQKAAVAAQCPALSIFKEDEYESLQIIFQNEEYCKLLLNCYSKILLTDPIYDLLNTGFEYLLQLEKKYFTVISIILTVLRDLLNKDFVAISENLRHDQYKAMINLLTKPDNIEKILKIYDSVEPSPGTEIAFQGTKHSIYKLFCGLLHMKASSCLTKESFSQEDIALIYGLLKAVEQLCGNDQQYRTLLASIDCDGTLTNKIKGTDCNDENNRKKDYLVTHIAVGKKRLERAPNQQEQKRMPRV